jgi:hypothetical protein
MKPPPRLLDDPSVAPELRADLKRAASSLPAYNAAAGLANLQAAIGSSLGAPASAATHAAQAKTAAGVTAAKSATLLGTAGAKVALVALGSAALVTLATLGIPARVTAPRPSPASRGVAPTLPAATEAHEPVTAPPAELSAPMPAPTVETQVHTPASHHVLRQTDPDEALRLEVAQLGRIKSVLDTDPAQAYRLAEAGHKTFSRGMLRPEREALATLALWNLGRHDEATRRAEAFLTRYPTSPLRARLQQLVENR